MDLKKQNEVMRMILASIADVPLPEEPDEPMLVPVGYEVVK